MHIPYTRSPSLVPNTTPENRTGIAQGNTDVSTNSNSWVCGKCSYSSGFLPRRIFSYDWNFRQQNGNFQPWQTLDWYFPFYWSHANKQKWKVGIIDEANEYLWGTRLRCWPCHHSMWIVSTTGSWFSKDDLFTKGIMYAPMTLRQMDKKDKRRACYQHCCLQYLSGQKKTNESFRGRLNISNENYSMASRIIADTISVGYIKPDEAASSKKYAKYVPFWA